MHSYQPGITFVVNQLTSGGILTALKNTLSLLPRDQYDIEVVSIYKSEEHIIQQLPRHVHVQNLDKWRTNIPVLRSIYSRLYDLLFIQKKLLRLFLSKNRQQVVIAYADGRAVQLVSYMDSPCKIAWVHTDIFSKHNRGLQKIDPVLNVYKKFDRIVTVSQFLKNEIQSRLPGSHNIYMLYNPVLKDVICQQAEQVAPNIKEGFILSVGRLSYEKGMDLLIKAYSLLSNTLKDSYSLYIIGDGEQKNQMLQLIQQLGLTSHVKLLGKIDNPYPYIKRAALVVVPSLFEGFGLAALEAQILGVPVLGTKTGGLHEILDDGEMGILCEMTKEGMAASLQEALADLSALKVYVNKAQKGLTRFNNEPIKEFFENLKEMPLSLYANGPIGNHGCEALYRSLGQIVNVQEVFTLDDRDTSSTLWEKMHVQQSSITRCQWKKLSYSWFKLKWMSLWNNSDYAYYVQLFKNFGKQIVPGKVYASIGGDNYCYKASQWLYALNRIIRKQQGKTILLGCSISPEDIDGAMLNDLSGFDLILARESITYQALVKRGLKNVVQMPDPAFALKVGECSLPPSFIPGMTVGLNISPVVLKNEKKGGILLRNIETLIQYILENTTMNIALIPHVVLPGNNDLELLNLLYEKYSSTGRILIFSDADCCTLKYIIGQCRYLIAARTHASIAAYSQSVPTLVIGYSVKAEGIAKDLFGTAENYVLDVRALDADKMILNHFQWLMQHEDEIKSHYRSYLPHYMEPLSHIKEVISNHLFPSHA